VAMFPTTVMVSAMIVLLCSRGARVGSGPAEIVTRAGSPR